MRRHVVSDEGGEAARHALQSLDVHASVAAQYLKHVDGLLAGDTAARARRIGVAADHTLRDVGLRHRICHRGLASPKSNTEFKQSLRTIEGNVPAVLAIHLVMDNYGTHETLP